jgi:hypothetical protein
MWPKFLRGTRIFKEEIFTIEEEEDRRILIIAHQPWIILYTPMNFAV